MFFLYFQHVVNLYIIFFNSLFPPCNYEVGGFIRQQNVIVFEEIGKADQLAPDDLYPLISAGVDGSGIQVDLVFISGKIHS